MNTVVWIVQILLALTFLASGIMKLAQPVEKLAKLMGWVKDFSPGIVRAIGAVEVLGALGLILPAWTGILPWLTPLAAVGLVLTMIGASLEHARRKEFPMMAAPVILGLIAFFVIYGRVIATGT